MNGDNAAGRSGAWAIILLAAAMLVTLGSAIFDVNRGMKALTKVQAEQTAALETAKRAEAQLNALATGTRQLADGGNANARLIIETLRRNGIQINPNASPN